MTAITAKLVSELRERSGAGMMDCKKALVENNGDIDAAEAAAFPGADNVESAAKAQTATIGEKIEVRRVARIANDGPLATYSHGGKIGVIVALKGGSEELAKGIAMHVAAMNPPHIKLEHVPAEFVAKEKEIALSQMTEKDKAKPAEILE